MKPTTELLNGIINNSHIYEDGETGNYKCMLLYCEDNDLDADLAEAAFELWSERSAQQAGIPAAVVQGEAKLSDYFSTDYIASQTGIK